jgi:hypothetical protein
LAALGDRRARGADPAHGGEAGRERGRWNADHVAAAACWDGSLQADDPDFVRNVLPKLSGVPLRAIAAATGLSEGYCSFVRRGLKTPHRRHWAVLIGLASERGS